MMSNVKLLRKKITTTVTLDPSDLERLEAYSHQERVPRSMVVRRALDLFFAVNRINTHTDSTNPDNHKAATR